MFGITWPLKTRPRRRTTGTSWLRLGAGVLTSLWPFKGRQTRFDRQMISVAAAIKIPVTNAVKQENSSRSLRTTLMAASPCGPWFIPRAQRTAHLYRGRKVIKWNFGTSVRVAFADPRDRVSHSRAEPSSCESDAACLRLAALSTYGCKWRWPQVSVSLSDQCEQFNDAYSDHQHSKCYGVVIEPMRPW
jgi:hypothetical protein